ncbi:PilW family protein [Persephonella sp.]
MENNNRGLSILELLVSMVIFIVIMGAVYVTYIKLLKGFRGESTKVETQIEKLVGAEIIRLDLEHVGYGISSNETAPILEWNPDDKILTLRSTLNNTRKETIGWFMVDCSATCTVISRSFPEPDRSYYVFYIDAIDKTAKGTGKVNIDMNGNVSFTTTPPAGGSGRLIGFPITEEVYNGTANGCETGYCNIVKYALSSANLLDKCNPNTYNLLRRVGAEALNNTGGDPILNCVADYTVTFDLDTNNDGAIDTVGSTVPALDTDGDGIDNTEIRNQLKRINFYLLIQEGGYQRDFNFTNVVSCGGNTCINGIDVDLVLPVDYQHYNWKVVKLSVKPMDL